MTQPHYIDQALIGLIESRIGQGRDGQCLLTLDEASSVINALSRPMEAVALWGCADGNGVDPRLVFLDKATADQVAAELGLTVQALAVIPTQGGGND